MDINTNSNSEADEIEEGKKVNERRRKIREEWLVQPSDRTDRIGSTLFSLKSRYILFYFLKKQTLQKKSE